MQYAWRYNFLVLVLIAAIAGLIWRMVDLSVINRAFLLKQSDARILRTVNIPAYRGMITDRNGVPLAVSTPVDSVWANPQLFHADITQLNQLANLTGLSLADIREKTNKDSNREFVYLVRGLPPETAGAIKSLQIPGLFFQREYKRYYPGGPVTAHIVGFTNIDDKGQEGLELGYNDLLQGTPGKKQVLKDRLGHIVAELGVLTEPQQGHDLTLSIDSRIQYLAYTALAAAVPKHQADSGSVIVLDVKTGEILAMVNIPSYNPNDRPAIHDGRYRNRAVTDVYEPGSVMKAFSVANALASGKYTPNSIIDTRPGWMVIDGTTIHDDDNNGLATVTKILQQSSNVGVAKMTLSLPPDSLFNLLTSMGFGKRTDSGFPGEASGVLIKRRFRRPIDLTRLAFGYGVSVTALQLANAYAIIARGGISYPLSFLKVDQPPTGVRVMDAHLAQQMLKLFQVVIQSGTGKAAQIPGYLLGGKTGTAYLAIPGGYAKNRYENSFIGIAPISDPRLVVAVVLHDVKGRTHLAAYTAAPVFAQVMSGALRYLNIPPDALNSVDNSKNKTDK